MCSVGRGLETTNIFMLYSNSSHVVGITARRTEMTSQMKPTVNKYCPLVINFTDPESLEVKWSLSFIELPEKKIEFYGPVPTRDELVASLVATTLPMMFIPIIEIVIAELTKGRK